MVQNWSSIGLETFDSFDNVVSINPAPTDSTLETKGIDLVVVPRDKPAKRGGPVRLTPKKFIKICHLIEAGLAVTRACEAESVTYQIFRLRISKSPRLEQRYKKAELIRSEARRERALAAIMEAGATQWPAYAWMLERCWPHLYALKTVSRVDAADNDKLVGAEIPMDRVLFYGKLMADVGRENEQSPVELPSLVEQAN